MTNSPRMTNTPPVSITINKGRTATDGDVLTALADALGQVSADVEERQAAAALNAGTPFKLDTALDLAAALMQRTMDAKRRTLDQRATPASVLLRSLYSSLRTTSAAAAAPQVVVQTPEYVEVETRAQFDDSGRMTGTKTVKQAVKR